MAIHDERLNSRVDSMIKDGLIQELLDFHDKHNKQRIQDGNTSMVYDYLKKNLCIKTKMAFAGNGRSVICGAVVLRSYYGVGLHGILGSHGLILALIEKILGV
ncbi:hypothetical protein B5X24_HaOG214416 [Helicoverpa armigera]|nr:hypothetical protein B5X24_HaOG214416 [Helicoverpa armigera]